MTAPQEGTIEPPPSTHGVQAAAEGVAGTVEEGDRVEFMGQWFRMADSIGLMPLLAFANSAKKGAQSEDMDGLAAMYALIRDCIHDEDWPRFERVAMDTKAEGDDIFEVVGRVMEKLSARPRERRGNSSAGRLPTSENSKAASSSPDTPPGRQLPDLDGLTSVNALAAR